MSEDQYKQYLQGEIENIYFNINFWIERLKRLETKVDKLLEEKGKDKND